MTFRPLRHFQPALKVRTVSLSVFLFVSLFVFVVLFAFVLSLLGSVPASQAKNLSVIEVANNNFEIPRTSESKGRDFLHRQLFRVGSLFTVVKRSQGSTGVASASASFGNACRFFLESPIHTSGRNTGHRRLRPRFRPQTRNSHYIGKIL